MRIAWILVALLSITLRGPAQDAKIAAQIEKQYKAASAAQLAGNFVKAKKGYADILHTLPNFFPAHLNLASVYLAEGSRDQMRYHLNQAFKSAPANDEVNTRIALIWAQANEANDAQIALKRVSSAGRSSGPYYHASGIVKIAKGDRKGALSDMEKAYAKSPGDARIVYLLAALRIENDQAASAEALLQKALKRSPGEPTLWQALAEACVRQRKDKEGVVALEKAHALAPDNVPIAIQLARGYELIGNLKKATDFLGKMIQTFPLNLPLRIEAGDMFARASLWKEAQAQYLAAQGLKPRDAGVQNRLATVNVKLGNPGPAAEQFKAVLKANPKDTNAYVGLEELYKDQHMLNPLIRLYQEWMSNIPQDPYPSRSLADLFHQQRDDNRAGREYARHLKLFPKDVSARRGYAVMLEGLGKRDQALAEYRECKKLDKEDRDAWLSAAAVLFAMGKVEEGVAELRAMQAQFPTDRRGYSELGHYYYKTRQYPLAETQFRHLVTNNPKDQEAMLMLARTLENQQDVNGALDLYEKLLLLSKNPSSDFPQVMEFLVRNGRKEEAGRRWRERVAANPMDPVLRDSYGSFLIRDGKLDEALVQFKEWKRFAPNIPSPRLQIAMVYKQKKMDAEWLAEMKELLQALPDEIGAYSTLQRFFLETGKKEEYWDTILPVAKKGSPGDQAVQSLVEFSQVIGKAPEATEVARARTVAEPMSKGAWNALARGLEMQQKWPEAIDAYTRAARLDPSNLTVLRNFCNLAEERGTKTQAVGAWKLYTDTFPFDVEALLRYGAVLRANGQDLEALDAYRKVLEKYPDNEVALKAVKELDKPGLF